MRNGKTSHLARSGASSLTRLYMNITNKVSASMHQRLILYDAFRIQLRVVRHELRMWEQFDLKHTFMRFGPMFAKSGVLVFN